MGLFGGGNNYQKRGQPGNAGQFASDNRGATPPNTVNTPHTSNTQTTTPDPTVAVDGMYDSFQIKTGARTAPQHAKPKVASWYNSMNPGTGKNIAKNIGLAGAAGFAGLVGLSIGGAVGWVALFGTPIVIGYFIYRAGRTLRQGGRNAQLINQQAEFAQRHNIQQDPREAFQSAREARRNMRWPRPKLAEVVRRQNEHVAAQLRDIRESPHGKDVTVEHTLQDGVVHLRFRETDTNYPLGTSLWDPRRPDRGNQSNA